MLIRSNLHLAPLVPKMMSSGHARKRLRAKTPPPQLPQSPLPSPLVLGDEAPDRMKRKVYLITFPHPRQERAASGERLVAPSSLTKEEMLERILDSFSHPIYTGLWLAGGGIPLMRLGVFREWHKEGEDNAQYEHDHSPVLGVGSFRYNPVKLALLRRHGLASHWSCTHDGYWSCVRYCAMPTPKKPRTCLDPKPVLWDATGSHPPIVLDAVHEPVTAKAMEARRQQRVLAAAETGKAEPRFTDLDVWSLVVRANIRNTPDNRKAWAQLVAYAKAHCGSNMVQYLFKRRHQLSHMIDDIWEWESIDDVAAFAQRSRMEAMEAAASAPCTCSGAWMAFVITSMMQNNINLAELCYDVLNALKTGRSEATPVIVLAGKQGGECKSAFLKPLHKIFDEFVFNVPKEGGNYPLLDLEGAKVAFLDEYRFDPDLISWATQCLWFDGSPVPHGRPQNIPGASGNGNYKGTAPIFITTKLPDLQRLEYEAQLNPATGQPWNADASMVWRRLKIYTFLHRVNKPAKKMDFCVRCFSQLLYNQAATWEAANNVRQ